MKKMKLLKLLLIFLIPLSLFAKEEIDGAFGIKLGQESPNSSKLLTVEFTPVVPLEAFNVYEYTVTPISKQVHSIRAYLTNDNFSEQSMQQCYDFMKLLGTKYPEGSANSESGIYISVKEYLDSKGNSIKLVCHKVPMTTGPNEIKVISKDLLELAEEERLKLVFEKFKKSGL